MYKENSQLRIEDFVFPYGELDPENDWVKLAALVPWDVAEQRYAARFVNNGRPAHPCRMALGALLIQRRLKCSDEWLVKHMGENPYLQYFIGMKEYGPCPFGASTLVAFRKRFSEEDMAVILEASVPKAEKEKEDDTDDDDPPNGGTLVLDATCCPADIAYPQDVNLLNQAREKLEQTVDVPPAGQAGLSAAVQEQKAQCQSDPLRHQEATAIHPPGRRIYCPIRAKRRQTDRKTGPSYESGDHGLRAAADHV